MSPARPRLQSPSFWPVEVQELVRFALYDSLAQDFVASSCNRFFEPSHCNDGDSGAPPRTRVRRGQGGSWAVLPAEWQRYFEAITDANEREETLVELSRGGQALTGAPASLLDYLGHCRTLALDRTCSDDPILSFPSRQEGLPRPRPFVQGEKSYRERTAVEAEAKINIKNALKAGKSPKKEHEVDRFGTLVAGIKAEGPLTHCVDVGSGRAHLSRALACSPLDLHVLAIDWSASQKSGAERLDTILTDARLAPTIGSLTHEVCSLDASGVASTLGRWPPGGPTQATPPSLLVALHACGDLTPDAIKAFISVAQPGAKAVFVGCCYNLQTPSLFPLSTFFRELLPTNGEEPMNRSHLRLTPQAPPTWHLSPASTAAWRASTLKLAYRARFEAELVAASPQIGPPETHRIGRVAECKSWETYRERAVRKLDDGTLGTVLPELEVEGGVEGWETALFLLRVFWTVRSWLGPPLESLCVLDRFALLCEGLEGEWDGEAKSTRRRVELVNLFEQATGSLRNLALVVR
ncbi:hypothetical protein BMF94_1386 [Rhodotorula taiwanensis]|uniref:Methyltransferase domain-containing protein n=1 Tax=Rhodotorula taiwanensis TaxID=741276 RepID=A0A2S5BFE1_9BASI|nr:hypothetical protein BMF94_1386 [Rhodotorula taiwanensis]